MTFNDGEQKSNVKASPKIYIWRVSFDFRLRHCPYMWGYITESLARGKDDQKAMKKA